MTATATSRTFSFPPPAKVLTENQRLHWAERARRVKAWRTDTAWYAIHHHGRTLLGPSTVDIAIPVAPRDIRRDPANWIPTCKAAIDGLVDAGWFEDDSSEYVTVLEPTLVVGGDLVTVTVRAR